jgi:TRAP-type mannitol/chloroaromatic compound transport system permease large subunit
MVMWIAVGATAFSTVYTAIGAPQLLENLILAMDAPPMAILIGIQLTFFVLGMFLDPVGIIMICTPVFVPVIQALGFDSVWFGILFIMNMEMAFLTPPYGFNLFYLRGVVPEGVSMGDIYRSVTPFVILQATGLGILIAFPDIALLLPNLMFGA